MRQRTRAAVLVAVVLLGACKRETPAVRGSDAGSALEQAARAAGMIDDPATATPAGVFAADSDRICALPLAEGYRVGVSVDYGDGQRCVARGRATGRERLDLDLGGGCRFGAVLSGDRIRFPATVPAACARACSGRATLAAIAAPRLSNAVAEAAGMRGADGTLLCGE